MRKTCILAPCLRESPRHPSTAMARRVLRRLNLILGAVLLGWAALPGCVLGAVADPVLITEFMAANTSGLADEDGEFSDWIEIHNAGDTNVNLTGWHLTDDDAELSQWTFPAVELTPGAFLIVFASGKDR